MSDTSTAPSPLQEHTARPCPVCGYDLRVAVEAGAGGCPECGWTFTAADLALLGPSNADGAPKSLNRSETRISGPLMLIVLALISALFVISVVVLARL